MEIFKDELSSIEERLFQHSLVKKFLDIDDSEEKIIYKSYINRLVTYLVYNDTELNNLDEVLDLFLKRSVRIITILDILHVIKKEFISVIKDKGAEIDLVYETIETKQNYLVHRYVESYFKKYSDVQLILEELELKEIEFERQAKIFEEYKKAVDYSSIVSKTDTKGNITYVNDNFCEISGYSSDELLGKSHSLVRDQNEPKELYQELWDTIQDGKVWHGVIKNRKKDGSVYIVEATIMPIVDYEDNIVEYIAIRKDITELETRKIELERIKASELRDDINKAISISHQEMLNNIPLAAIFIDKHDKITGYNEEFSDIFDFIESSEIYEKIENSTATVYDICSDLEESVWKYEMDTVDNKLETTLKNSDKNQAILSVREIEDKFLVIICLKD
jgi:PAS domain S-box-containing protein